MKENCCPDCGCHFVGEYPFNYEINHNFQDWWEEEGYCLNISHHDLCQIAWENGAYKALNQAKPTITKLDGKVVAVTMTDDEHRITEVLWEAPKPLSDEEIKEVWFSLERELNTIIKYGLKLARAIEERHGIK